MSVSSSLSTCLHTTLHLIIVINTCLSFVLSLSPHVQPVVADGFSSPSLVFPVKRELFIPTAPPLSLPIAQSGCLIVGVLSVLL